MSRQKKKVWKILLLDHLKINPPLMKVLMFSSAVGLINTNRMDKILEIGENGVSGASGLK